MTRIYILLIIIGVFATVGIEKYFEISFEEKLKARGELSLNKLESIYNAVTDTYTIAAQKDFINLLSNEDAVNLLKKYKYATEPEQNVLRGELYRLLHKDYALMKTLNVRQFHLHTHEGDSLLRFHIPYESGDPLLNLRTTIYKANVKHEIVSGFEAGRIYPGYRYVFPIIIEKDHLGSVEFSISFEGIEKKLKNLIPNYIFQLMMTKESSLDYVFKWHQSYFTPSKWHENYYVESPSLSSVNKNYLKNTFSSNLEPNANINEFLLKQKSFSAPIISKKNGYFAVFLAFKNTDEKHAGYIVSLSKDETIFSLKQEIEVYKFLSVFVLIIVLVLVALLMKNIFESRTYKLKLEELNMSLSKSNEQLERFIDLQDSIVILTDGKEFIFANRSFYKFFGYENLEAFKKDYLCICDRFIVNEHFFSLELVKEDENNWVESMLNLPERKRIVSIHDFNATPHAFSVGINIFDETTYVISFSDISETMIEKLHFEKQATRDVLTGAYNRAYLENSIDTIRALYKNRNLKTSIIFFDIDHFKNINDSFGHDTGDIVLQELVKLVQKCLRQNDYLIRWGGEEFLVIIGINSLKSSSSVAENLRKQIELYSFSEVKKLTCSFGVSIEEGSMDINSLISKADKKLYEAKNSGRNVVCS